MTECEQQFEDRLAGEELYGFREQRIREVEKEGERHTELERKAGWLRRAQIGVALAPLVAAGSLLLTETGKEANNLQKSVVAIMAATASGLMAYPARAENESNSNAEKVAKEVKEKAHELGIDSPSWATRRLRG